MRTKKALKETQEACRTLQELLNKSRAENEELTVQRKALVKENLRLTDHKDLKEEVITSLGQNIVKSLKTKNAINMKPDEKDSLYYLLECFIQLIQL